MEFITFENAALTALLKAVGSAHDPGSVFRLRVARDGDSVKFKVNEYGWSPPYPLAPEQAASSVVVAPMSVIPELAVEQVRSLMVAFLLEEGYANGVTDEPKYAGAHLDAQRDPDLKDVYDKLTTYFSDLMFSPHETSMCAVTLEVMRETIVQAYRHANEMRTNAGPRSAR